MWLEKMAQNFAETPLHIYNALVNDATFMSYVGTYNFSATNSSPSIIINTPGNDLPKVESQVGMEVIIHDIGDMTHRSYITDSADAIFSWRVFLIVWAPGTGDTVRQALTRLVQIFPGASSLDTVSTGVVLGSTVQTQVIIPSDSLIVTA